MTRDEPVVANKRKLVASSPLNDGPCGFPVEEKWPGYAKFQNVTLVDAGAVRFGEKAEAGGGGASQDDTRFNSLARAMAFNRLLTPSLR